MEKKEIEDYIKKLQEFENELNNENTDVNFLGDLDVLLTDLQNTITNGNQMEPVDVMTIPVKIKKLNENAVIPCYSKEGDAGMDLTITSIYSNTSFEVTYGFGVALEIPSGYVGLVFPRSSIKKYDISLTNCVGVIDSGYRGELMATFRKHYGLDSIKYNIGDRGAQIIIMPYPKVQFIESDELSDTERGSGGFGSTGK